MPTYRRRCDEESQNQRQYLFTIFFITMTSKDDQNNVEHGWADHSQIEGFVLKKTSVRQDKIPIDIRWSR